MIPEIAKPSVLGHVDHVLCLLGITQAQCVAQFWLLQTNCLLPT